MRKTTGSTLVICITTAFAAAFAAGCGPRDCLPEPEADTTPPEVHATVEYTEAAGGRVVTRTVAVPDSALVVEADASAPVRVVFRASDAEGLRALFPGVAVQQTVGVGVERRALDVPPVEASCPRPDLVEEERIPGIGQRRELIVSAAAESWTGLRAATPTVTVRLR